MNSKLFTFNFANVKSAIISGVLMALFAMCTYIVSVGNIFTMDYAQLANIGAIAGVTSIVSLLKSMLTTSDGKFVGMTSIK